MFGQIIYLFLHFEYCELLDLQTNANLITINSLAINMSK
jgi:hypothetical protein